REQRVKELQARLDASAEAAEATAALGASLEEASREKEALLERCGRAEAEASVPRGEHEAAQAGLRAEAVALEQRLGELSRRHEKTCEEVFRVQRQALFMKSERQAAEDRLAAAQKQLVEAQNEARRLRELHGHAEDSARLVRDRDRKITELSKEVFRLKEALNALPESRGPPQSPPATTALQARIRALEEKLAETETRHSKVVTLYRSHLLYAVQ
ncbi:ANR24 protein, partial [Nyctibius grandis]|nr:ANR24 protein [Nyctibius grandis]